MWEKDKHSSFYCIMFNISVKYILNTNFLYPFWMTLKAVFFNLLTKIQGRLQNVSQIQLTGQNNEETVRQDMDGRNLKTSRSMKQLKAHLKNSISI